jgi:hypothetical protein
MLNGFKGMAAQVRAFSRCGLMSESAVLLNRVIEHADILEQIHLPFSKHGWLSPCGMVADPFQ